MVMEMGAFSISLAQTGRIPHREAARGNTPIPSKRLPSLMSGMARGAVSLHGKHPFQCGRRNAQPPGNRKLSYYLDNWDSIDFDDKRKAADGLISTIKATSDRVQIEWKI